MAPSFLTGPIGCCWNDVRNGGAGGAGGVRENGAWLMFWAQCIWVVYKRSRLKCEQRPESLRPGQEECIGGN